jgi:AraC-like DNA-binding protein
MGKVSTLFVHKVLSAVDSDAGHDDLLRTLGIEPNDPVDPAIMLSDYDYYAFLERLTKVDSDPVTLPLRVGATMQCHEYGAFGFAWKTAPNLLGSFERAERHARALSSVSAYEAEQTNEGVFINLHRDGERQLGMRLSNEATVASIAAISREVSTEPLVPLGIFFKHPAPKSTDGHENYFGCPVYFESDRDALLISIETSQKPNKLGDEKVARFFDTHLQAELAHLDDKESLDRKIRNHISQALSEGVPAISAVAGQFGMSGRTLQRRLSDSGQSFQSLVDQTRRQLAQKLLKETDYSLAEVGFMTGFSEQSAFNRAFKRWAGQTPRSFRIKARN